MKKIKVLSLFNGMNCIGLALHSLGVEFDLYASEIDKYATKVSDTLFPNTINLGDVTKIDIDSLPTFDLIVAGSPCQGFSFAGKQLNFNDERSKLFFDFVKILEYFKNKNPNVKFLLENVKMKKEYEAVISRFMGIDPIEINSALLSAQNRRRLYWTNIGTVKANLFGIEEPGIKQPKDKGILLKDILELEVDEKYSISKRGYDFVTKPMRLIKKFTAIEGEKALCLTAKGQANWTGTFIKADRKGNVSPNQNKSSCLSCGGNGMGNHSDMDILIVPEATKQGYVDSNKVVQLNQSKESGGKQPYQQNRVYDANFKSPCLDTDSGRKNVFINAKIRRLTPKECMRLQTVPEWAIEKMLNCGVSDSQLYKMLGNGWTVAVIAYILKHEYKKKQND